VKIIGSIFPEKLEFDGTQYRTARINAVVATIFQINNELCNKKNRKSDKNNHFSCVVPNTDQISKHFVEDLERIVELNNPIM
jgi:protein-tyrosine phosphatase